MKFTQTEWLKIFTALEYEPRFNIVLLLINEGKKTLDEIAMTLSLLPPTKDGRKSQRWLDTYINPLLTKGLIDYADRPNYRYFEATQKARDVLEIILPSKVGYSVNTEKFGENRKSERSVLPNIYKEERTVGAPLPSNPTPTEEEW